MQNIKTNMEKFSPIILRIGLGLVMIWFSLEQIMHPASWVGYLPEFIVNNSPIGTTNFVLANGWFELIFGVLLIKGLYTRVVAGILALHLLSITLTVGYNEIGVRDFGLTVGLISIFLHGPSSWSLDEYFELKKNKTLT